MTTRIACRICDRQESKGRLDRDRLVPVIDFGSTPLANRLLGPEQLDEVEPTYPLALFFCPRCSLLQLGETVAPDRLFRDYVYFSSFSESFVRHAEIFARRMIAERRLDADSLVVEAASNDGYLLQHFVCRGIPALGIEPARNVAKVARDKGVETIDEFFGASLGDRLRDEGRGADLFVANNVLAHVPDLDDFVRGIGAVLAPEGVASIEVPYVRDLVERLEFDTVYHEHVCYYSLTALERLFGRHDLTVNEVERLAVHGGSLRLLVGRDGSPGPSVEALLAEERRLGIDRHGFYRDFGARVSALKESLSELLWDLKRSGHRLAAYGAAAKGTMLLNLCGIGRERLDFVVDRSPHKQGRFLPGVRIPVVGPERLLEDMPDHVLLLVWNLTDEILAQQTAFRERGGKFILPIPEPKIV